MPGRSRRDLTVEVTCNVVVLFCATCIGILWAPQLGFSSFCAPFLSIFFLRLFHFLGVLPRSACPCIVLIDYFRRQRRRPLSRQQSPEASAASTRRVAQRRRTHSSADVQCDFSKLQSECRELIPLSPASSARTRQLQSDFCLTPLSSARSAKTCQLQSEPWLIPLSSASGAGRRDAARKTCAPLYSLSESERCAWLKELPAPSKRSGLVPDHKGHTVSPAESHQFTVAKMDSDGSGDISHGEFLKAIRVEAENVRHRDLRVVQST